MAAVALYEYLHSSFNKGRNNRDLSVSDYYEALKVSPNATPKEIKEAYDNLKAEKNASN